MKKVKQVEFAWAENRSGAPDEPQYFAVGFQLKPKPSNPWLALFDLELQRFNENKKSNPEEPECFHSGESKDDKDYVYAECNSVEEIGPLHDTLKQLVRQTNEKLEAAEAKALADKKEIERLIKTLKSDI